ncbi:CHAP domain-containing protein [Aeromicrobium sp. NPDC092404]|uniref:CHAP domain-containing protein n=1 Tax=Aeromicrobium sp. NPDC092404 TaxID=3154976 RepID=UPI0034220D1D
MRIRRLAVAAALALGTLVGAAPAQATEFQIICNGWADCADANRSTYGYQSRYTSSFWSQSGGHNCTNYVAWRLTHNGRVAARVPGTGSATTWKQAVLDHPGWGASFSTTPKPSTIAWWPANSGLAGPKGHVAYVQKVETIGGKTYVTVSEDNEGGAFRWVRVSGSRLPHGYLSFAQASGTVKGEIDPITSPSSGRIDVSGFVTDPDSYASGVRLKAVVRNGAKLVTFTSSRSAKFAFTATWSSSSMPTGPRTVYLYGSNVAGTRGASSVLLHQQVVDIKP